VTAAGAAAQAAYYRDAMTFSIVARSDDGDSLGVAVASKFLAVGSAVPAARLGVGAVATQSFCNTLYKRDGLQRMADGASAGETLDALLAADGEREERQAGIVDAAGLAATWTGSGCMDWAGGFTGPGFAIQGNILTGPEVLDAMRDAFVDSQGQALAERLLAALRAGDAAGGDRRGRQSAALLVVSSTGSYTPGDDLAYDLRVDDHPEPVSELERLLGLHHLFFDRPTTDDLLPLEGELAVEVSGHLARLGYPDLETWAGVENYELRVVPGQIDTTVLARLREQAGSGS
jgi:uncharacterized Ntn-hydrolase superfamily protein